MVAKLCHSITAGVVEKGQLAYLQLATAIMMASDIAFVYLEVEKGYNSEELIGVRVGVVKLRCTLVGLLVITKNCAMSRIFLRGLVLVNNDRRAEWVSWRSSDMKASLNFWRISRLASLFGTDLALYEGTVRVGNV